MATRLAGGGTTRPPNHRPSGAIAANDPPGHVSGPPDRTRSLIQAHLVQRERQPLARLADQLSRPEPGHEKRQGKLVELARTPEGYAALLARFAQGPARWSPIGWMDEQVNFLEYVIHHEDVRRGTPHSGEPRQLPEKNDKRSGHACSRCPGWAIDERPVGVTLALPAGESLSGHRGQDSVTVLGDRWSSCSTGAADVTPPRSR